MPTQIAPSDQDSGLSVGAIVGIVVAAVVLLMVAVVLVTLVVVIMLKHNANKQIRYIQETPLLWVFYIPITFLSRQEFPGVMFLCYLYTHHSHIPFLIMQCCAYMM